MVLPLGTIRMFDSEAPAPADVEMVLRTRYGPDWRVDKFYSKGSDEVGVHGHDRATQVVPAATVATHMQLP